MSPFQYGEHQLFSLIATSPGDQNLAWNPSEAENCRFLFH